MQVRIDTCFGTWLLRTTECQAERNKPSNQYISGCQQCFLFSRNIGYVTPKIIYFRYLIKYFPDQSIQKKNLFNFEQRCTGCQVRIHTCWGAWLLQTAEHQAELTQLCCQQTPHGQVHTQKFASDLSLKTTERPAVLTSASFFKIKLNIFWILWSRKYFFR